MEITSKSAHSVPQQSMQGSSNENAFIFPSGVPSTDSKPFSFVSPSNAPPSQYSPSTTNLSPSVSSHRIGSVTPRGTSHSSCVNPSGLSILLSRQHCDGTSPSLVTVTTGLEAPTPHLPLPPPKKSVDEVTVCPSRSVSITPRPASEQQNIPTETSVLLSDVEASPRYYTEAHRPYSQLSKMTSKANLNKITNYVHFSAKDLLTTLIRSLPAVILGVLLNILDGVSCMPFIKCFILQWHESWFLDGLIIFPTIGIFADLRGLGVSMFFVSCVLCMLSRSELLMMD
jgi:hypothetical protein